MSSLGTGVMIRMLFGGRENERPVEAFMGDTITEAALVDDKLQLVFASGRKVALSDEGQSCCESRYITTDDNVSDLVGGKLVTIEERDGGDQQGPCSTCQGPNAYDPPDSGKTCYSCNGTGIESNGSHDLAFVVIQTDKSSITLCTHNEHNGYYGGFALVLTEVT